MTGGFTVTLTTPFAGGDLTLKPLALELTQSLYGPAKSMSGRFALEILAPECRTVQVRWGERLLFSGKVDRQRSAISREGIALEIEARDKGAALLDNEAMPKMYENLTVARLFQELLAPHDFVLVNDYPGVSPISRFAVAKGQSLWDAFGVFTRLSCGLLPFVRGDMVLVARPAAGDTRILGGKDTPFTELAHTLDYYKVLSHVLIRDDAGAYPTAVANPAAAERGISRTRYFIPAGEYACRPQWDADQRIRRSMAQLERVSVTLPGVVEVSPGESVWINAPLASLPNLMADQVTYRLSSAGAVTRLELGSAFYY